MFFTSNTKDFQVLQWHLYQSRKTRHLARKTLLPFQHFAFFRIPQTDPCAHTDAMAKVSDHVHACRSIDASDKTCERDHSLRLKLPGLSPLSFLRLGWVILLALYFGGPSSSTLSQPESSLTIDRVLLLLLAFILLPRKAASLPRARNPFCGVHTPSRYIHVRVYPRDRIKRIRVWWIEFNMVITSDENARPVFARRNSGGGKHLVRNSIRVSGPGCQLNSSRRQQGIAI